MKLPVLPAVFAPLLLLTACSGSGAGFSVPDTTGTVRLSLPAEIADESGAQTAVARYTVDMVSAAGFTVSQVLDPAAEPAVLENVEAGVWRLDVTAEDAQGVPIRSGLLQFSLSPGGTAEFAPMKAEPGLPGSGPPEPAENAPVSGSAESAPAVNPA
ncbi:MAG: hypothetical protein IAA96_02210 [Spirochaetes bacterium]|uniref:Uncharacterized protein n=1 Tax=Candidatus Avitreponema avistercoris TaxID=2840705 RepID=A0A9D9ELX9_9SPIR|nr:hypothetical protein [Candidatus Avitreponema avistercoris]